MELLLGARERRLEAAAVQAALQRITTGELDLVPALTAGLMEE